MAINQNITSIKLSHWQQKIVIRNCSDIKRKQEIGKNLDDFTMVLKGHVNQDVNQNLHERNNKYCML